MKHPRHLDQRRIAGRVVGDALVPRVDVRANQQETLAGSGRAGLYIGDRERHATPLRIDVRDHAHPYRALGAHRREPLTVGVVDSESRDAGDVPGAPRRWRAPDTGADHLVDNFLVRGPDMDMPERAALLGSSDAVRPTVHRQHDLAAHIQAAIVSLNRAVAEDHRPGFGTFERHVDKLGHDATFGCLRAE
jgi:hypothetical protein